MTVSLPAFPAVFQSTLPVWGGTVAGTAVAVDALVSIHPPRVGRDLSAYTLCR